MPTPKRQTKKPILPQSDYPIRDAMCAVWMPRTTPVSEARKMLRKTGMNRTEINKFIRENIVIEPSPASRLIRTNL